MLPGLQSSVALWRLQLASELLFVGDASATDAGRASRRQGIEWNNHYIDSKNLLLGMDVSLSCARFTDSDPAGDWIPGSVETVVSAGATLRDLGPWSASLQVRRFGPRARRGQFGAFEGDDAHLRPHRLSFRLALDSRSRRVQHSRSQGERHRLSRHLAAAGGAPCGHRGHPFPSRRAAHFPPHAQRARLSAPFTRRCGRPSRRPRGPPIQTQRRRR